jgi:hypothetical protein
LNERREQKLSPEVNEEGEEEEITFVTSKPAMNQNYGKR